MTAMPLEPAKHEVARLPIRALRVSLWLGVFVDLAGAVAMRFLSRPLAEWLKVPVPIDDDFWPRYSAVFLVVVPLFYVIAALNPTRYLGNVAGAVLARLLGFAFYFGYFLRHDARQIFLCLAAMNLVFAAVYSWLLRPVGWSRVWASLRPGHGSP
jgi:hypothetical protein